MVLRWALSNLISPILKMSPSSSLTHRPTLPHSCGQNLTLGAFLVAPALPFLTLSSLLEAQLHSQGLAS